MLREKLDNFDVDNLIAILHQYGKNIDNDPFWLDTMIDDIIYTYEEDAAKEKIVDFILDKIDVIGETSRNALIKTILEHKKIEYAEYVEPEPFTQELFDKNKQDVLSYIKKNEIKESNEWREFHKKHKILMNDFNTIDFYDFYEDEIKPLPEKSLERNTIIGRTLFHTVNFLRSFDFPNYFLARQGKKLYDLLVPRLVPYLKDWK